MRVEDEITKAWEDLGRDPRELDIKDLPKEEKAVVLEKLRAIKYSFDLLFSKTDGVELAIGVLKEVFKD